MKIILLNAPPGGGKDTGADGLIERLPLLIRHSFKSRLDQVVMDLFQVSTEDWKILTKYENKNNPSELLNGMSSRKAQQFVSQKVIKPNFGDRYFADCIAPELDRNKNYLFTDHGFHEELESFIEHFGAENILLIRVHRDGADWSIDTRDYVYDDRVKSVDITNPRQWDFNGPSDKYIDSLYEAVRINGFLPKRSEAAVHTFSELYGKGNALVTQKCHNCTTDLTDLARSTFINDIRTLRRATTCTNCKSPVMLFNGNFSQSVDLN